jgi:hypothetical protein
MSDQDFISLCKALIGERYLLGTSDNNWRQRDFEALARIIEEKSGIRISLSTLKRLWRSDFNQRPHPATLDALASLMDCADWLEFKNHHRAAVSKTTSKDKNNSWVFWIMIALAISLGGFLVIVPEMNHDSGKGLDTPVIHGPIHFSADKTISKGVPNTVIFKYDVNNIQADSFYLQQSWNEKHRVAIQSEAGNYSSTYYTPGYHRAKLLANDSIVKLSRIHIQTNGWLPLVKYTRDDLIPIYLRDPSITNKGQLSVSASQLYKAGVDIRKEFILNYHNVKDFGLSSDNFKLNTRIKCDSISYYPCPKLNITLVCEEHIFYVPLTTMGCVGNIGVKFGEVINDAKNSDLSAFGVDIYEWQDLNISVKDKEAMVMVNQQPIYRSRYKESFGKIMGLVISFTGTGSIDHLQITDQKESIVFMDTFL